MIVKVVKTCEPHAKNPQTNYVARCMRNSPTLLWPGTAAS